jgi:hypothetical protein
MTIDCNCVRRNSCDRGGEEGVRKGEERMRRNKERKEKERKEKREKLKERIITSNQNY